MPAVATCLVVSGVVLAVTTYQSRRTAAERETTWPSADATVVRIDRQVKTDSKNRTTTTVRSTVRFPLAGGRTGEGVLTGSGYGPTTRIYYDPAGAYDVTRAGAEPHDVYCLRDFVEARSPETIATAILGVVLSAAGAALFAYSLRARRSHRLPLER